MLTTTRPAPDPVADALADAEDRGVAIEPWLDEGQTSATATGPVLYLVDAHATPPTTWGPLEDWVRVPADAQEIRARVRRLARRAFERGALPISIEDGRLRIGSVVVVLSSLEAALLRLLVEAGGEMVAREPAVAALWPDGPPSDPRALDNRLKNLRHRLRGFPLRIETVRGRGFVLDWDPSIADERWIDELE